MLIEQDGENNKRSKFRNNSYFEKDELFQFGCLLYLYKDKIFFYFILVLVLGRRTGGLVRLRISLGTDPGLGLSWAGFGAGENDGDEGWRCGMIGGKRGSLEVVAQIDLGVWLGRGFADGGG